MKKFTWNGFKVFFVIFHCKSPCWLPKFDHEYFKALLKHELWVFITFILIKSREKKSNIKNPPKNPINPEKTEIIPPKNTISQVGFFSEKPGVFPTLLNMLLGESEIISTTPRLFERLSVNTKQKWAGWDRTKNCFLLFNGLNYLLQVDFFPLLAAIFPRKPNRWQHRLQSIKSTLTRSLNKVCPSLGRQKYS